jgi:hypothetical protein
LPITDAIVSASIGATATVNGSGLGGATSVSIVNPCPDSTGAAQGPIAVDVASAADTAVTFVIPEYCPSGQVVTVLAGTTSLGTFGLRVVSQYVTSAEFGAAGFGSDVSGLAAGELDNVLIRASSMVDRFVGGTLRSQTVFEVADWRGASRRVYPKYQPFATLRAMLVRISTTQTAQFTTQDVVANLQGGYFEILSYAVASYALFGALQNLGFVANIVEFWYDHGFTQLAMPQDVKDACGMIASVLLTERSIEVGGFSGYEQIKQGQQSFTFRGETYEIPLKAAQLLSQYRMFRMEA